MSTIVDIRRLKVKSPLMNTQTLLTYSMEQSPSWKANQFSANQEIPCFLWNRNVRYHIHKCPLPCPSLEPDQCDPGHPCPKLRKIYLNILLSVPGSSKWSLSLAFPHQNPAYTYPLHHTCYMPCPSHY